ncbi:MAG: hypothetical protein ACLRT4_17850 [Thomasclavelia sp.]
MQHLKRLLNNEKQLKVIGYALLIIKGIMDIIELLIKWGIF